MVNKPNKQRINWKITVARILWWLITGLSILLFLFALPIYVQQLNQVCNRSDCLAVQLNIGRAIILELSGIGFSSYVSLIIVIQVGIYLINLAIGVFLFARKSNDWLAILVSLMLLTSIQADLHRALLNAYPGLSLVAGLVGLVNSILIVVFFYIFPTGSFNPSWTAWLAGLWSIVIVINPFSTGLNLAAQQRPVGWVVGFLAAMAISSISVLVYRYRKIFNPDQQKQTRWVVYGVAVTWGGELLLEVFRFASPVFDQNAILFIFWNILALVWTLILPVSILIAILRTALLDIDFLIRRTLAYSILTLTLLIVYLSSVLILQRGFEILTGQQSPFVAIISTLIIAALFNPLRQRIQQSINQFFYRNRYNAEMAIQAFSASVREDVNMVEISTALVSAVRETLQPEYLSVWLVRINPKIDVHDDDLVH